MKKVKEAGVHLFLFFAVVFVLWIGLVASALIKNDWIKENMQRSAEYYRGVEAFDIQSGKLNKTADHYADTILLNISWHMGKGNPVVASLDTKYYEDDEYGENYGFYASVVEGAEANTDYTRYFHGMAMFVRVLHLFTNVEGIKSFGIITVLILVFLICLLLGKKGHMSLGVMLLLSLAAVHIWNIRLSMEYQAAFVVCMIMCLLYLWAERKGNRWLSYLSVVGGTLVSFYDFLTTETIVLLVPLVLVVAVREREGRLGAFKENIFLFLKCAVAFGGAYAGTYIVKWTAATLVTGENKFLTALSSVGERVAGGVTETVVENMVSGTASADLLSGPVQIPAAVLANLTTLFGGTQRIDVSRVVVGVLIIAAVVGSVLFVFHKKNSDKTAVQLLAILSAVVFVRFMVLSNHSYLHEFFTYRALVVPVLALLIGVGLSTSLWKSRNEVSRR